MYSLYCMVSWEDCIHICISWWYYWYMKNLYNQKCSFELISIRGGHHARYVCGYAMVAGGGEFHESLLYILICAEHETLLQLCQVYMYVYQNARFVLNLVLRSRTIILLAYSKCVKSLTDTRTNRWSRLLLEVRLASSTTRISLSSKCVASGVKVVRSLVTSWLALVSTSL